MIGVDRRCLGFVPVGFWWLIWVDQRGDVWVWVDQRGSVWVLIGFIWVFFFFFFFLVVIGVVWVFVPVGFSWLIWVDQRGGVWVLIGLI